MNTKNRVIAFIAVIIILVISITFSIITITGNKTKEIKVSKEFIKKLQKADIVDSNFDVNNIEFKSVAKVTSKDSKTQFTVIAENFGVDLNSKYAVTGFSQKLNNFESKNQISEDEARRLAEKYINEITNEKFLFKEIRKVKLGDEEKSDYTIAFYKYVKDYPYYDNEIVVSINKYTGKLENYSNQSIEKVKHNLKKYISYKDATTNATEYFNKLSIKTALDGDPLLAVIMGVNGEYDLTYVVNIKSINEDNTNTKYKVFINAETGEVVNKITDIVEGSRSN